MDNRFSHLMVGPAKFGGFVVGEPRPSGQLVPVFGGSLDDCLAFVRSQFATAAFETWSPLPGEGEPAPAAIPARRARRAAPSAPAAEA